MEFAQFVISRGLEKSDEFGEVQTGENSYHRRSYTLSW